MSVKRQSQDRLKMKIPDNPRYKHIKPVVDSGASMTKYLEHLEEIRKNYKFKKSEIFRRIKATTFAQLLLQVADVDRPQDEGSPPIVPPISYPSPPSTARSTLMDLVTGMGEMDGSPPLSPSSSFNSTPEKVPVVSERPYLLLDVREPDDFRKCHIVTAVNYPAFMLSRSCNPFTKEILHYKNKEGYIIIVYDVDESIAPDVATKMIQRDFDNVFMLSGGMKVLSRTFPEGLVTGSLPPACLPSPPLPRRRSTTHQSVKDVPTPFAGTLKENFSPDGIILV
jgi:centrosomal protein CEP41